MGCSTGNPPPRPELLALLADLAGCTYLSDLRSPRFRAALPQALSRIPPEMYTASEWRAAACYLVSPPPPGPGLAAFPGEPA